MQNRITTTDKRYHLIDALRGFALLNMVLFHLLYDVFMIFSLNPSWAFHPLIRAWERFICCSFILISGVAINFSKNSFKRGIIINAVGFIITAVTVLIMPNQAIWFGILNFLGCAMMMFHPLKAYIEKIPPLVGTVFSLVIFLFLYGLPKGFVGFCNIRILELPDALYQHKWLAFLGFPSADFFSTDYFPILPWIFLFTTGYFAWRLIENMNWSKIFRFKIPVLGFIGKKSIIIYVVHQPVIMGFLYTWNYLTK